MRHIFHLRLSAPHPAVLPCLFGGIALLTFLLSLVCLLPSEKQVAARIDETGLAERTGTMREFRRDDSDIARIQREDAVWHLAARKPSDLREEMKEAALRKEQKEALDQIIDELEKQLREDESRLDQAADMQEAMDTLARMLEERITKDEIGEARMHRMRCAERYWTKPLPRRRMPSAMPCASRPRCSILL